MKLAVRKCWIFRQCLDVVQDVFVLMSVEDYEDEGIAVYFEIVVFEFCGIGDGVEYHFDGMGILEWGCGFLFFECAPVGQCVATNVRSFLNGAKVSDSFSEVSLTKPTPEFKTRIELDL